MDDGIVSLYDFAAKTLWVIQYNPNLFNLFQVSFQYLIQKFPIQRKIIM